jgi:hypothetical protein
LLGALRCGRGHKGAVALLEAKGAKKLTSEQWHDVMIEVYDDWVTTSTK